MSLFYNRSLRFALVFSANCQFVPRKSSELDRFCVSASSSSSSWGLCEQLAAEYWKPASFRLEMSIGNVSDPIFSSSVEVFHCFLPGFYVGRNHLDPRSMAAINSQKTEEKRQENTLLIATTKQGQHLEEM